MNFLPLKAEGFCYEIVTDGGGNHLRKKVGVGGFAWKKGSVQVRGMVPLRGSSGGTVPPPCCARASEMGEERQARFGRTSYGLRRPVGRPLRGTDMQTDNCGLVI